MSAVFGMDLITAYLLLLGLLTMLVATLLWQQHRSQRTVAVWLAATVLGVLLGGVCSFAAMRLSGNHLARDYADVTVASSGEPVMSSSGGPDGGKGGGGGMGGGGGGSMGGGGMGGGAARGPQPKGELTSVVRKLDLLTGDVAITLAPAQAAAILKSLADLDKIAELSDDVAKAKHEEILATLDATQKAKMDAINLPRPAMTQSPGGAPPPPPANPFTEPTESKALSSLAGKLTPKTDATPPAPEAAAPAPDAVPPAPGAAPAVPEAVPAAPEATPPAPTP
ncbi:MAG: hypothetical protein ACYC3X_10510 [Pirellulaceae bacterium]